MSSRPDLRPVVIGYDGSAPARAAVAEAARLFPGRLAVIVSVWRSIAPVVPASLAAVPAGIALEAQATLDAGSADEARVLGDEGATLAARDGLQPDAVAVATTAPAWRAIIRAADERDAAAVVVGTRGHSALGSAILGSVSSGVIRHCRRPVVVVRGDHER